MKLLVISNMAHYLRGREVVGHGSTAREIDHLATLFDEVVHVACLHDGEAPASALPYAALNVRLRAIPPAGGTAFRDKVRILSLYPYYARAIWDELSRADVVHVRCPANLSLLAIVLLALRRTPAVRWVKYAGSWQPYEGEALSYRLQRWWLNQGLARAKVTVNGRWASQPAHVYSFLNPSLTHGELVLGRQAAGRKRLALPVQLVFIGHLTKAKGAERALEVVRRLHDREVPCHLTFIGGGPARHALEQAVRAQAMTGAITFAGWVPRSRLGPYLVGAHIVLLPSRTEGWPKVLSEGMAYGVVPVASAVGSIPEVLADLRVGVFADSRATEIMAESIADYVADPERWKVESSRAVAAAPRFSYDSYLEAVRRLILHPVRATAKCGA